MENINQLPVIRSISLPSREHPCSVRIEALLNHLKSFQYFSSSFEYSHTILQSSLIGLAELYNCVAEFMTSPTTQQALMLPSTTRHYENNPLLEQSLEGSITLLDTCNAAREVLLAMNQHVQTLQSALRRKGGGDSSVEADVHAYLCFRKKAKKNIVAKCLAGLKRMESNNNNYHMAFSNDMSVIVKVLGETSSITISIFRSLLKFLSTPISSTNTKAMNGWSLISKMMRKRLLVPSEKDKVERVNNNVNLVAKVDVSLHSLLGNIQSNNSIAKSEAVQLSQRMLETLNSSSESLVVGLDCMFRCLVQNRVSLLNILTQ